MEELKKKIAEAMNCEFVGNCRFDDEELSKMYSYSEKRLREFEYGYINKISTLDYEILFVAMVNSVKTWTSDEDTFWNRIAKKLSGTEICSQKLYHALTEIIDRLGERNKIIYLNGTQKRYYSTILAHAFAPLQSTESFFELCWQIYCEDMAQNFDETDSIFQIVSNELSKRFAKSKGDEDFQLGSKIYNFRAGIKRIAVEQCDLLTEYIRNTINAIDKLFSSEPIEKTTYYYSLLLNWWRNKETNFGIEKAKASLSTQIVSDYSAIKPRYINENGTVYLTVPAFRLLNNIYECPWIEIYTNDSLVYSEEMLTRGSGLSMSTKAYQIELSKILSDTSCFDIRLVITHGGTTIFDSRKSLERIFMLFNGEKEIFAQQCLPGNYQLYCRDLDFLLQYPTNIKKVNSSLFLVNTISGDVIQSKKRTVLFASEKQNRDIWIYADKKNEVKFRQDDEEYDVLDGELKIAAFDSADLSDYGVKYEDTSWKLQDFSKEIRDDIVYYNISELLNAGEPQKLIVFKFSTGKIICNVNVVKFNNINVTFDKAYYYGDAVTGTVSFSTQLFNHSTSFDIKQNEVELPIADGEIILSIPKIQWRIDDGDWNYSFNEKGCWYKTFNNSSILELSVPTSVSYNILITPSCKPLEKSENRLNHYKIGQQIYSNIDCYDGSMVLLSIVGEKPFPLLCIHTKEKFVDAPYFLFAQRHFIWNPITTYIGGPDDAFTLKISDKYNNTLKSVSLPLKSMEIDINPIEDGFYTIEIFSSPKNIFKKAESLYRHSIVIGDENQLRFKNKTIVISKVMLDNAISSSYMKTIYVEKLHFIGNIEDCIYYSGTMYFRHPDGRKIYLNTMKNDYGICETTNPVRIELRSNNTCWMVAGLESDDVNDFLGELFLDHYNQLSNIANGNKPINYYFFETREDDNV